MKRVCVLLLMMIFLVSFTSCSLFTNETSNYDVYNTYVDFYNYTVGGFAALVRQYFNKFGYEETLLVRDHFSGFSLYDYSPNGIASEYSDNAREAAAENVYGEADSKMLMMCDAFDAISKLYEDVDTYYKNKEYENDDFTQGKALHTQMFALYTEFLDAKYEFTKAFQPIIIEMEHADLEKLRKRDYLIQYYTQLLILNGESISELFYELEREGASFLDADIYQYEALFELYSDNLTELLKIYQDANRQKKEGYVGNKAGILVSFGRTASQMRLAGSDILAMIKAGTEDVETQLTGVYATGGRTDNAPGKFDELLDRLIGYYNNMIE